MPMAFYPGASSRSWAELSRAELAKIASRYSLSESLTHFTAFTLRAKPGSGLRAALRQCGRPPAPQRRPAHRALSGRPGPQRWAQRPGQRGAAQPAPRRPGRRRGRRRRRPAGRRPPGRLRPIGRFQFHRIFPTETENLGTPRPEVHLRPAWAFYVCCARAREDAGREAFVHGLAGSGCLRVP